MTYRPSQRPGPWPASVPASLAIDRDKFPSLPTQKALLLIDFQNDFVTPDGAVPVSSVDDALVQRAAKLAGGFRNVGLVVWVQSQFEHPRRFAEGLQIITAQGGTTSTAEAFLSSGAPECVQRGSHGWQLAEPLKEAVVPGRDMLLMKTHYSAFQGTKLIQFLRSRLVTSLYICGSLINVGVHATTVDAAAHGYSIALVDDCCGWSDKSRADAAVVNLVSVSGCEVIKARSVVPSIGPKEDEEKKSAQGLDEREKAGERSSEKPVDKAWGKPGGKPGEKHGGKPGEKTGNQAREKLEGTSGKEQGEKPGVEPEKRPGETPGKKPGEKSGEQLLKKHAEKPEEKHAGKHAEKTVERREEKPAGIMIEADDGTDGLGLDDDLDVLKELKKKYSRKRVTTARTRSTRGPAEGSAIDEGGTPGDRVLRQAAPRPRAERARQGQDPEEKTEKARDIKEGMDKLSLVDDRKSTGKSVVEEGPPAADTKGQQPGRGGAADPAAGASSAAAGQGSKGRDAREDAGRDSKRQREGPGEVKSVASKAPCSDLDGKISQSSKTGKAASKTPRKPTPDNMEATTTNTMIDPTPTPFPASPPGGALESTSPTVKESEPLCEGDTKVFYDVLPPSLESDIFAKLKDEVDWQRMSHLGGEVPRLVAVQGTVSADGSHPVYRHPADESPPLRPFSPTVSALRKVVQDRLGHRVNHVLIQMYRGGRDYISEHSDKTLDIIPGSSVANLSLGAERTMVFRTKRAEKEPSYARDSAPGRAAAAAEGSKEGGDKVDTDTKVDDRNGNKQEGAPRQTQRARLPHNSLLSMGLETNAAWLHSIRRDGRLDSEKTAAELSFSGERISLTFRQIGTFLDSREELIWGQGARGKSREEAGRVANGGGAERGSAEGEAEGMVRAFGVENRMGRGFDWDRWYGKGFDVLHMTGK